MDEQAKKAAAVNTNSLFRKYSIHCPKGNRGWAEEKFWLVIKCQQNNTKTVDELCKHQFEFCCEHISATPHALLMDNRLTFYTMATHRMNPLAYWSSASCLQWNPSSVGVTTHLFGQHSLASLSDCSLSSQNPALSHQQRCLTDAMDFVCYTST